jgi:hypothetical protein
MTPTSEGSVNASEPGSAPGLTRCSIERGRRTLATLGGLAAGARLTVFFGTAFFLAGAFLAAGLRAGAFFAAFLAAAWSLAESTAS